MKAIIMAGGQGTRLKSVTGDTPKPMALLAGKPVLEHILLLLKRCGIDDVCMSLHYRPEVIMDYFGDGAAWGMRIAYHIESTPLGTAGGVKACADFLGKRDFLVISGDAACDFDLPQLMEAHRRHLSAVTMAVYPHESPLQYGTVLTDSHGLVVSFAEKPTWTHVVSDLINTGIYIVSPAAMELVPEDTAFDFSKDLFPLLMERGMEIRALPMSGYWCDIGTPRAYYRCNLDALDGVLNIQLPPQAPSPTAQEEQCAFPGEQRELPCRSRARAMRLISQSLMEAGADFSDGVSLSSTGGRVKVRISPSPERESIVISAQAGNSHRSRALAAEMEEYIKNIEHFS